MPYSGGLCCSEKLASQAITLNKDLVVRERHTGWLFSPWGEDTRNNKLRNPGTALLKGLAHSHPEKLPLPLLFTGSRASVIMEIYLWKISRHAEVEESYSWGTEGYGCGSLKMKDLLVNWRVSARFPGNHLTSVRGEKMNCSSHDVGSVKDLRWTQHRASAQKY